MGKKVSEDVLMILGDDVETNGSQLVITAPLDRRMYTEVNKVLEGLGGKWDRKAKAHVFEGDAADLIDTVIATGEYVDFKQVYQFFPTPEPLARQLVEWAEIGENDIVLEPSAGDGGLLRFIMGGPCKSPVLVVELDKRHGPRIAELTERPADKAVWQVALLWQEDFLTVDDFTVAPTRVVMNPPFTRGQDVKHIMRAYELLAPGGILVAVCCEGPFFREDKNCQVFRRWLEEVDAEVIHNDGEAFKASGTNVRTRRIKVRKEL